MASKIPSPIGVFTNSDAFVIFNFLIYALLEPVKSTDELLEVLITFSAPLADEIFVYK
jgi:hypothetical protein